MKPSLHLVTLLITFLALSLGVHAEGPKVEIYYETLQVHVRQFFIEQFRVVSENLLDKIDLRLYPYGNTKADGGKYTCKSELQCQVNAYHACMIKGEILEPDSPLTTVDKPLKQSSAASYVQCYFKNKLNSDNDFELGSGCFPTADAKGNWNAVVSCVMGSNPEATTVLFEQVSAVAKEQLAASNGLAVRVAGQFVDLKATSLVEAICKQLTDVDACTQSTKSGSLKVAIFYEALNWDALRWLDKQLGNFYRALEDLATVELIPYGNTVKAGEGAYNCPLGAAQCISNKFMALVIDKYITSSPLDDLALSGPLRVANFHQCLAQSQSAIAFVSLEACSNEHLGPADYGAFITGILNNSAEVVSVFERMRVRTEATFGAGSPLPRVPTVTINGQASYGGLNDLLGEACSQQWAPSKAKTCTKTKLTLLYEPFNHRARTFFLESLSSLFSNLLPLLEVELIPAGWNATVSDGTLTCPGGLDQCTEMQLQACALEHFWANGTAGLADPLRQDVFGLIGCTFKNRHFEGVMEVAERCANEHIALDPWSAIHECYQEGVGRGLVAINLAKTAELVKDQENLNMPTVLVNGKVVEDHSTIKKTICDGYTDFQPAYCSQAPAKKVPVSVYYESTGELSKHFFTTQYGQYYTTLEELAAISLYPAGNIFETVNGLNGSCDSYGPGSACMANKLMAVIIDQYSDHPHDGDYIDGSVRTMLYHRCYYGHPHFRDDIYQAAEYCAENFLPNDDWLNLEVEAKTPEGAATYAAVLEATKKLREANGNLEVLDPVPWVTLGEGSTSVSRVALNDLLQSVCEHYTGADRPLECTPVEVTVFYSARHAQSRRFFVEQLATVYWHLRERIRLQLVPYGLAVQGESMEAECGRKADNCMANIAQACALNLYYDAGENSAQWDGRNQTLAFIGCMFKNVNNQNDGLLLVEDCANEDFILADQIKECAQQAEGWNLLKEMRQLTLELGNALEPMEHAPWILINGLRSATAQTDLKGAICGAMTGDLPDFCLTPTLPKVSVAFHYSAQDSKVQRYVIEELYPHYRALEEVLDLDVIPFGLTDMIPEVDDVTGNLTGQYSIFCINGEAECRANLIHACLYRLYYHNDDDPVSDNQEEYDGKLQFIEFLKCHFSSLDYPSKVVDAATSCGTQIFGDAFSSALSCAQGPLGQAILAEFEQTKVSTLLPHLKYIPWITVNGRHSYTIEHHIRRTICDSYQGTEKPLDCYQSDDTEEPEPSVTIHYEVGDAASRDFFARLANESSLITAVAKVALVPFGRSTYAASKNCRNNADCTLYMQHACLLKLFFDKQPTRTLQAIACAFSDEQLEKPDLNACVDQALEGVDETDPDPWPEIHACVGDGSGEQLMTDNEALVGGLTPQISHIPWVEVEGVHEPEAEDSLLNELCGYYYPTDKPAACVPKPLEVGVYYETNNSAVGAFFAGQLATFTEYLDEFGSFSFIPYGSAATNSDGSVTCPGGGDNQCKANAFHACVINRYYNASSVNPSDQFARNRIRTAGFLGCHFAEEAAGIAPSDSAERCFNINFEGLDDRDILSCAIDGEGTQLLVEMGRQTAALSPALSSAPVVTISGVALTSDELQQSSGNFFQKLCTTYGDIRPAQCASLPSSAVKVELYFSGNQAGFELLSSQLYPFYEEIVPLVPSSREYSSKNKLYNIIRPELVAWGETKYDNSSTSDSPFTCTGPNECYINRFFACAKYFHADEPRGPQNLMKLALCAANKSSELLGGKPSDVFNECSNLVWPLDAFTTLEVCATANSSEYFDVFLREKTITEGHPEITAYPALTLNNIASANATANLLKEVCLQYDSYSRPTQCKQFDPEPVTPEPVTITSTTTTTTTTTTQTPPTPSTPSTVTTTDPGCDSTPITTPGTPPVENTTPTVTPSPSPTPSPTSPSSTIPPTSTPKPGGAGTTQTASVVLVLLLLTSALLIASKVLLL